MEIKKPQLGKVGAFAIFLKREVLQHLRYSFSVGVAKHANQTQSHRDTEFIFYLYSIYFLCDFVPLCFFIFVLTQPHSELINQISKSWGYSFHFKI